MKRFLIICCLFMISSLSVLAVCSIDTGVCRADVSGLETLEKKLMPSDLEELKTPKFEPPKETPSYLQYNFDSGTHMNESTAAPYDASCQFGACIGRPVFRPNEF